MFRRLVWLCITGWICSCPFLHAKDGPDQPQLFLALCDKAGLNDATRQQAKESATRILDSAGLRTTWSEARSASPETAFDPNSLENCELHSNAYILIIITDQEPKGWTPDVLGLSPKTDRYRRRAYILHDRVKTFAQDHRPRATASTDLGLLLGSVIAHEVGHLLMPGAGHAPTGLMRARWGHDEAAQAAAGTLVFGSAQQVKIRRELQQNPMLGN